MVTAGKESLSLEVEYKEVGAANTSSALAEPLALAQTRLDPRDPTGLQPSGLSGKLMVTH